MANRGVTVKMTSLSQIMGGKIEFQLKISGAVPFVRRFPLVRSRTTRSKTTATDFNCSSSTLRNVEITPATREEPHQTQQIQQDQQTATRLQTNKLLLDIVCLLQQQGTKLEYLETNQETVPQQIPTQIQQSQQTTILDDTLSHHTKRSRIVLHHEETTTEATKDAMQATKAEMDPLHVTPSVIGVRIPHEEEEEGITTMIMIRRRIVVIITWSVRRCQMQALCHPSQRVSYDLVHGLARGLNQCFPKPKLASNATQELMHSQPHATPYIQLEPYWHASHSICMPHPVLNVR
ncbi:hypothetical protein A2U01_0001501 [Trifolium medium]|uniref:Uncharacterized protein n=1 Tax=Trifolium medium TaxID=97028 RepID=A0A392M155_9FABA|nr:hypothetical protein [Trifolium medium]